MLMSDEGKNKLVWQQAPTIQKGYRCNKIEGKT